MFACKKRKPIFSFLLIVLFCTCFSSLYAETFRVAQCHIIELTEDTSFSSTKKLGLNDSLAVYIPEERLFLEGIEFKMDIPEDMAIWRDCCGAYIYDGIKPAPKAQQIDYSGSKIFFGVVPGKLSWILQLPLTKTAQFKTNQYTKTIETIPTAQGNFVFLRLQQIMKGVPDEVMNGKITITVRPILSDKGLLKIKLSKLEASEQKEENTEENISIFIDNNPYLAQDVQKGFVLGTGIHNVNVISENYRTEVRKVRIDQAKITDLEIILKSIEPTVIITAPEGATVYLDDEKFEDLGKEVVIPEGDHKIRCGIGDYEIVRSLSVSKGRSYKVNLTVDLQISEDE
ncbi:MAG: PEGA domain-containing protein [Treponema sp.]|nr:PEGA domain-containing protein [Treponema sp.]